MSNFKKGLFKASQKFDAAFKGSKKHYDEEYNNLEERFETTRKNVLEFNNSLEDYLEPRRKARSRISINNHKNQNKDAKHMCIETKVADSLSKCSNETDGYLSKSFNHMFDLFCQLSVAKEALESDFMEEIKQDMATRIVMSGDEIRNIGKKVESRRIASQAIKMDKKSTEDAKIAAQEAFNSIKTQRIGMMINYTYNSEGQNVLYAKSFVESLTNYFSKCSSIATNCLRDLEKLQDEVNKKERKPIPKYTPVDSNTNISKIDELKSVSNSMNNVGQSNPFEPSKHEWSNSQTDNSGWTGSQNDPWAFQQQPKNSDQSSKMKFGSQNDSWNVPEPNTSANVPTFSSGSFNVQDINNFSNQSFGATSYNPFEEYQPTTATIPETTARVIFDFTAENDDELTVRAGDIISIIERVDENWYIAKFRGKQGFVPKEFFEINN